MLMARYKVKNTSILHNKTLYKEGSVIELSEQHAAKLADFVELLPNQNTSKTKTQNTKSSNKTKSEKLMVDSQLKVNKNRRFLWNRFAMKFISYDEINNRMIQKVHNKNQFRTVFVDYDDSPRRSIRGIIIKGSNPAKFGKYLRANIKKSREEGNKYIFINAWNEWGEGNYLEPDKKYKYAYLNEVRKSVK